MGGFRSVLNIFIITHLYFVYIAIFCSNPVSSRDILQELCDMKCKDGQASTKTIGGKPVVCCPTSNKTPVQKTSDQTDSNNKQINTVEDESKSASSTSHPINSEDINKSHVETVHRATEKIRKSSDKRHLKKKANNFDGVSEKQASNMGIPKKLDKLIRHLPMLPMSLTNDPSTGPSKIPHKRFEFVHTDNSNVPGFSPLKDVDSVFSRLMQGKRFGNDNDGDSIGSGDKLDEIEDGDFGDNMPIILLMPEDGVSEQDTAAETGLRLDGQGEQMSDLLRRYIETFRDESSEEELPEVVLRSYDEFDDDDDDGNEQLIPIILKDRELPTIGMSKNEFEDLNSGAWSLTRPEMGFGKRDQPDSPIFLVINEKLDSLGYEKRNLFNHFAVKGKRRHRKLAHKLVSLGKRFFGMTNNNFRPSGSKGNSFMNKLGKYISFGKRESLHPDMLTPFIIEAY